MSSSWTFGRIGLATSAGGDGLELPPHLPPQWDGDELTLVCDLPAATVADQVVLRDQFIGYDLNPDEPVVPITSVEVPSLDGFYRVQEVNVDDRLGTFVEGGEGSQVTVVARKVPGFTAPLFEVRCDGADRINSHALTGDGWVAFPHAAIDRSVPGTATSIVGGTIAFAYGDIYYDSTIEYAVNPDDTYQGAPTLTIDGASVVGRQVGASTDWEISNGLVRVKPSATEANHLTVGVRNAGATDYDDKSYRIGWFTGGQPYELGYDGTTRDLFVRVVVVRNSPECVTVRLVLAPSAARRFDGGATSTGWQSFSLDVTVRRGQFWSDMVLASRDGTQSQLGVWRSSTDAGSSITGGIEDDSADAAGNKWRIYTPITRTADTTNGGLYASSSVSSLPFAVGNNRNIRGVMATYYFAAMNHKQRIVAR